MTDRVDTVESSTARAPAYDRDPPFSPEAEVSVLGGMLIDTDAVDRAAEVVNDSMFFREAHRRIFRAMLRLFERGDVIDVITVSEELKKTGELEQAGGLDYLAELLDAVPTAANIEYHARIVREKALLRRLIDAASTIIRDVYEPGERVVEEVLDQAEQRIFQVAQSHQREGFVWIKEILWPTFEHIERLQESSTGITGVPTGFTDLDRMTTGLQKGDLCIVAARPAMGKTSWVLNVAQNAAIEHEIPVAIFSLEMSKQQLVQRFLCAEGRVDSQKLRRGRLSPEEYQRLAAAAGHLNTAPLWIDDSPGSTVLEMRAKARRLKAETDLGMLVIDYMQLMASDRRSDSRVQEVSEISRGLKALARELDVPVVALSQLSRAPEQRTDRRPQLSDLRESGCLTGDTLVDLADGGGRARLEDLEGREGFRVWALREETWELVPAEVTRAFSTGRKPVYRMTTRSGRSLRATANHKFRTLEGWKRLDELQPGDRIAAPRRMVTPDRRSLEDPEAALLGHLIGDGCTLPRQAVQYTTREPFLAEAVREMAHTVFGDAIRTRVASERSWYQVFLSTARPAGRGRFNPIRVWLEELGIWGLRSHEKRAPDILFRQSGEVVSVFLRHLWATDGCLHTGENGYPRVYYATSSKGLARDVQALMLRLGVMSTIRRVPQGSRGRDQFHVIVSGRPDILRFSVAVGAFGPRRTSVLRRIVDAVRERPHNTNHDVIPAAVWARIRTLMASRKISHRELYRRIGTAYCGSTLFRQNLGRQRAARVARAVGSAALMQLALSDVLWDEIVSIEAAGTERVYDLTVPGPHNFVADGIVAHNSIEQDADVVMFLYRPEYYFGPVDKDGNSLEGKSELIVGKQRNGPTGVVNLYFHKAYTRFDSVARSDVAEPAPGGDGSGAPFGGA